MNEIVNKFLLEGDIFMPQMHLRLPRFTYSACEQFTKNKERIQKLMETGNSRYIYQTKLDKARFQYDMDHADFKDLTRRTASDKIARDKAFKIPKNPKCDGYQHGLTSLVYKLFDKKASGGTVKNENISNKKLAEELHKLIIRTFKERKVQ